MELRSRGSTADDSESEEAEVEDHGPLLAAPATEEKTAAMERIKESTKKNLQYIRENKRKLAAAVMLWLSFLIATMSFSLLGPFFPQEALDMGANTATVGVIIGAAPAGVIILSPFMGYLFPLIGVHVAMFTGLFLIGATYTILGFAIYVPLTWGFVVVCLVLRTIEGFATALFFTSAFYSISKLFPDSVNIMMGVFQSAAGLGLCLGRPVGGILYMAGGFTLPFIIVGPATILISIPTTLLLQRVQVDKKEQTLSTTETLSISLDVYFIVVAIGNAFGFVSIAVQTSILEPYLIDEFQLNPLEVSLVFFAQAVVFVLTNIPAGLISDKIKYKAVVMVGGLLVAASGLFTLGLGDYVPVPKLWIVYVGMLLAGFGASFATVPTFSNMYRIAMRHTSDDQAALSFISGIISSTISIGQLLGFVFGGVVNNYVSFPTTCTIFGEVVLSEGLLLLGVDLVDRCI